MAQAIRAKKSFCRTSNDAMRDEVEESFVGRGDQLVKLVVGLAQHRESFGCRIEFALGFMPERLGMKQGICARGIEESVEAVPNETAHLEQDATDPKVRPWLRHGGVENELLDSLGSIEQLADGLSTFRLGDLSERPEELVDDRASTAHELIDRLVGGLEIKVRLPHLKNDLLPALDFVVDLTATGLLAAFGARLPE